MGLFGFGKGKPATKPAFEPKPRRITPFEQADKRRFHDLLCNGVIAENVGSFEALCETYAALQAEHPDKRVLATLDNPGQALYTSVHATQKHQLDAVEGHDLSSLPRECFEDGEHIGYLTTEAELAIRLVNLKALSAQMSFDDACGLLDWQAGDDEGPAFPDALILDPDAALAPDLVREIHFQFVPVDTAADALAALPNGYFSSDLTPMQCYAVARHFETHHGLKLSGVGASNLGFFRDRALESEEAKALARDIAKLYSAAPGDAVQRLSDALVGRKWLLLRYSEW
ncbi:hypothetical protein EH31_04350 [Erythrobacter longus]|uniref:DUF4253 domain-containing protein n=1 Tax=Erythrobacter longus TaxID=1044 RepID=A0A074MEL4_ERYLO|nr:hypothetical protein [Erythrobacter longus]KEO91909.1 hypothetical protein EH31_04350 [Erythrobacter longus]